jgi:hypothetical protein
MRGDDWQESPDEEVSASSAFEESHDNTQVEDKQRKGHVQGCHPHQSLQTGFSARKGAALLLRHNHHAEGG